MSTAIKFYKVTSLPGTLEPDAMYIVETAPDEADIYVTGTDNVARRGASGVPGPAGPAGADGAVGPAGTSGTAGVDGAAGADGADGVSVLDLASWVTGPTQIINFRDRPDTSECNGVTNSIVLRPCIVGQATDLSDLRIKITVPAAAASVAKMLVYEQTTELGDLSLVHEGASFLTDIAGIKTTAVTLTLQPDRVYWIGFINDGIFRMRQPLHDSIIGLRDTFDNDAYRCAYVTGAVVANPAPGTITRASWTYHHNVALEVRATLA